MLSISSASPSASTSQSQSVDGNDPSRNDTEATSCDTSPETSKLNLSLASSPGPSGGPAKIQTEPENVIIAEALPVVDNGSQVDEPIQAEVTGAAGSTDVQDEVAAETKPEGNGGDQDIDDGYSSDSSGSSIAASQIHYFPHRQTAISRRRVRQHAQHILMTEERIRTLQEQVNILMKIPPEEPPPPPPEPAVEEPPPAPRVVAIPELHFLSWPSFKRKKQMFFGTDMPVTVPAPALFAIDVLHGDPVLFYNQERKKAHLAAPEDVKSDHASEAERDNLPLETIPERIRINSAPLMAVLKKVISRGLGGESQPLVILRPYKPLLYHDSELREKLAALEARWAASHSDKQAHSLDPAEMSGGFDGTDSGTSSAIIAANAVNESTNTAQPASPAAAEEEVDARESVEAVEDGDDASLEPDETREAMEELRCLIRFMDAIAPLMASIRTIPSQASNAAKPEIVKVRFTDLWYLFHPGQDVLSRAKLGSQEVWRVIQVTGGRSYLSIPSDSSPTTGASVQKMRPLILDCYYIDFDGKAFGPVHRQFQITPFEESKDITTLEVFPIDYKPGHLDFVARLNERGQEFVKATKMSHKFFKGRTSVWTPSGQRVMAVDTDKPLHPEEIESAVIVDFDRALQFNPGWTPTFGLGELAGRSYEETREMTVASYGFGSHCFSSDCCENNKILPDFEWDSQRMEDFVSKETILATTVFEQNYTVSPNDFKLFPNRVFGFVLRNRKWGCFPLNCLKDIDKNRSSFDSLELSGHNKEIVVGLVDTHFKDKEAESNGEDGWEDRGFDLVRAKGKGLIILLHGAPGVGKTSTAECVAESNGRPLFPITCGDLGLRPAEVESNLDFNFQLAESWGCVLLLDEADVFLAQRTPNDIERNALVSIFLRALEYYSGILFLTTNRVGSIDEAFRSRIHMSLLYPPLSEQQTIKIWEGQLNRAEVSHPHLKMDKADILAHVRELYRKQMGERNVGWNGRQIRNAMKTAVALAEYDSMLTREKHNTPVQPRLDTRWVDLVEAASSDFETYLERAIGLSNDQYARIISMRADNSSRTTETYGMSNVNMMNTGGSPVGPGPSFAGMGMGGFPQQHQHQIHKPQRTSSIFGTMPGGMTQDDGGQQPASIFGQPHPGPTTIPQTHQPSFQQPYQQQPQAQAQAPQQHQTYSNFFSAAGMPHAPMGQPTGAPPASLYGASAQQSAPVQGLGQFQYPASQHPFQTQNTPVQQPQQQPQQQQPFSQFSGSFGNPAGTMQHSIPQGQVQQGHGQGQPSPFSNPLQPVFQGYPPQAPQAGLVQPQQQPQPAVGAGDGTAQ
ncbi:hypothetical protein B0T22DRAFT_463752 [Podospora appendiculata]|uniref:AAA+ ATPase domain-containing protein n=1 Tax=Podospora appendiculata TaxID=314037 RepID=A0AAE0XDT4_9PEZI|nr:hypothetical protein B0T22DRAFT_463752 [Podospora appendiculata]